MRLLSDPVVEQAKGVLMLCFRISSYEALAVLVRWSHQTGSPLRDLALAITHGVCQDRGWNVTYDPGLIPWLEQQLKQDLPDEPALDQGPPALDRQT